MAVACEQWQQAEEGLASVPHLGAGSSSVQMDNNKCFILYCVFQ